MVFLTASITDASPGGILYNALEGPMISDGWQLVDTVIIGPTTHRIMKSIAAGNAQNKDWYLDINYPTTGVSGGIRFTPFEDYNATTHIAYRGPIAGSTHGGTIEQTYYTRYGATGSALETTWANGPTSTTMSQALSTSSFTYYVSVTRNRIIMMITNVASRMLYAGFFIPTTDHIVHAGTALFPLVTANLSNSAAAGSSTLNNATMLMTRLPKYSSVPSGAWNTHCGTAALFPLLAGQVGVSPSSGNNQINLVRQPVIIGYGDATVALPYNGNSANASFVGTFDGIAHGYVLGTAVRGDTVNVSGRLWYMTSPTASFTIFMESL